MANFFGAALAMLNERGWLCIPLRPDSNGIPKIPITVGWTSLERSEDVVKGLPWSEAKGLGIVLGEKSSYLGVLDIDCEPLFDVVISALGFSDAPRLVRTARNRGHWYCYTKDVCQSTWREVLWDGELVKIELKTDGTQVAAPPTPGYKLLNQNPPQLFHDMEMAFEFFCDVLLEYSPERFKAPSPDSETNDMPQGAGFPSPWNENVPKDIRNKAAYIEAHRLREAKMPLAQALAVMSARFSVAYAKGDIEWREIESTVRSAYKKGSIAEKGLISYGDEARLIP